MRKPVVQFISTVDGLADNPECLPRPAKSSVPSWWKTLPMRVYKNSITSTVSGNIKNCPALPDYFNQGYVVPMWADTILYYDEAKDEWRCRTPSDQYRWDSHPNHQFLEDVPFTYNGEKVYHIFKAISPWRAVTPKGWSLMQVPLFYHYDNDFAVMPGVIDTDIHSEINQQVMIMADKKEIFIKRGTPFVQYIPYKRTETSLEVRDSNETDKKLFKSQDNYMSGFFTGSRAYNHKRKNKLPNG
jgi:hypothetical protein